MCLFVSGTLEIFQRFLSVPILDHHYLSHNLVMKHIPGADPELVLLNHYYEELDVSLCFAVLYLIYMILKLLYVEFECDYSIYNII